MRPLPALDLVDMAIPQLDERPTRCPVGRSSTVATQPRTSRTASTRRIRRLSAAADSFPEMFLTAAQELAIPPEQNFVIEDAGVQAAKAGNMAALGLARADDTELLAAAGADLVVTTLDDVDLAALSDGR